MSVSSGDSTNVPASETSATEGKENENEENEISDEKKLKTDHICEDSPSVAATATEEHLAKKPVVRFHIE